MIALKVLLLLMPICFCAVHSDEGEGAYSLTELIDIGLSTTPATKVAWWNAKKAASALGSTRSAYYPQIDFNATARNGRTFQFINGPDVSYTAFSGELILSMLLLDSGERRATVEAAKQALAAASWQSDWEIQKVMIAILENAYNLYYCEEALKAAVTSRDDAKKILDYSTELNEAGLSPITDVYTSKATLAQMEMDVSEKRAAFWIQRGKLATSVGLSADSQLKLAPFSCLSGEKGIETFENMLIEQLIALADSRRSDLFAQRARLQESIANQVAVQASYLPKLSFQGKGGYDHDVGDRGRSGEYQVRLNLDIPIFTGFKATYQNQIARADIKISEEALLQLQLDIALQIVTYRHDLEAAREMVQQSKSNLDNAKLAYEGILEKYSAGQERIAELSIALRQLTVARLRHSEVIARYLSAKANLAYATGTL